VPRKGGTIRGSERCRGGNVGDSSASARTRSGADTATRSATWAPLECPASTTGPPGTTRSHSPTSSAIAATSGAHGRGGRCPKPGTSSRNVRAQAEQPAMTSFM